MNSLTSSPVVTLLADPPKVPYAGSGQLLAACLIGILAVVLLITIAKLHPFLSLMLGSAVLGAVAFMPPIQIVDSFVAGFGSTTGSVGILIALGAMIGKILEDSGGANRIVATLVGRVGRGGLPWMMALIAAILGLPLFFEIGVVLLVPVIIMVAKRTGVSLMLVGIPALAGLSVLHGLVPPHPGPLTAIGLLKADLGLTLLYGIIIAIPTVIVAGPILARFVDQWVPKSADSLVAVGGASGAGTSSGSRGSNGKGAGSRSKGNRGADLDDLDPSRQPGRRRVAFRTALIAITLPVFLMLIDAILKLTVTDKENSIRKVVDVLGTPIVALLIAVIFAYFALGLGSGMTKSQVSDTYGAALPPIAGILLIVAAGGGFKQTLIDAGVGEVIKDWATGVNISALVLGWLVAVLIRLGTGSATVATITAAGIVGPLGTSLSASHLALLVLAIGCGSLFFSHVNDAGFWLVKEYFGLTVGETIKSWSVMETVISVFGFALVMLLSLVV
ncbi:gluconate transporter [Humibacillus sp. DSM 29435]|uniref:GntP family permease n=1 Tax=Humibacillus sp. DSM 29435 TaxID=1869167 RepID=UPI0008720AEB|nr:SLC13 family permease [Humibacillus sp. DSM 29435]OFE18896.1 gluconate transporter [Humibacillus sp. DSM 29435]